MTVVPTKNKNVVYPESDGKPMADNTLQFRWIVMLQGGLDATFKDRPDVFVAGDLLWYPVEGQPKIRIAPDTLVAFGRPKGHRGSYLQWNEGDIAPQVVFEVLSPGNTSREMRQKRDFYEQYGVEEYYLYDPDKRQLQGWLRQNNQLVEITPIESWVSPHLGIRFEPGEQPEDEWRVYGPDGRVFVSYVEVVAQRNLAEQNARLAEQYARQIEQRARLAEQRIQQVEQERRHAEQERQRAEQRALAAEQQVEQERWYAEQERQRAELERARAEQERQRAEQLEARLKELLGRLPEE
jgi:Uma2 family endonuclease